VPGARLPDDGRVPHQTVVIRLELHLADDALTGRASDGAGAAREFVGWLGLVAAIDALLPGNAPAPRAPASVGDKDYEGDLP
jgi:hypothetical protein